MSKDKGVNYSESRPANCRGWIVYKWRKQMFHPKRREETPQYLKNTANVC